MSTEAISASRDSSIPSDVTNSTRSAWGESRLEKRRRALQITLGAVWLIDAALQLQPFMFSKSFVTSVLEPAASGNPWFLSRPMLWADHLMIHDIAWWNTLFAIIQFLIGVGLLRRTTVRFALGASVAWSVAVWWFAEGFGGIFSGASPLSGEPGAVVLYAIMAVVVWPTGPRDGPSVVTVSAWRVHGAAALWAILWVNFALCFVTPANRTAQGLHDLVAGATSGEPRWVGSIDGSVAGALQGRGLVISFALALVCVAIAIAIFVPSLVRGALALALLFAAFVWLTQDFGGIFTSRATDLNSAPLLALLAWSYWPLSSR
ncbi:MAG: hypothetical protein HKL85_09545 [Acidimicrobiaceae bacterium]|nr:hypothetical protein [Acidimicrobiaceae bacterium]